MNIKAAHVAVETANVMQSATFSAVELGNFPLSSCDVQCAFECWCATLPKHPCGKVYPGYAAEMETRVRAALAQLGFRF